MWIQMGLKKVARHSRKAGFGGVEPDVDQVDTPGYTKQTVDDGQYTRR
jgi:hypothetical protein